MTEKTCDCHGEAMRFCRDDRYKDGGFWVCRPRERARYRKYYAGINGVTYNRKLLKQRRSKALARQRRRNSTGE